ncbi:MAG: Ig-like domain-containing protein [Candidatus Stygibacter australis]|nr:Ig-like domain-containing protein [Candidatus Stygibacter australis]MDP8321697.1 Ig-like domain-containing protein [Candidatus Stygibacter australis]
MKYLCLIILVLGLFTGCSDDPTNPDTTCPYVTIVYPNDGDAFFEGSFISVTAEATDNAAIDSVQFYLDSELLCSISDSNYQYNWDTTDNLGTHSLIAKAYDTSGNTENSVIVNVAVYPNQTIISNFTTVFYHEGPSLYWATQCELNNSGWNIYRFESDEISQAVMINQELITGSGTTTQISEYSFMDIFEYEYGLTYYYWLESVDISGITEIFDPVEFHVPDEPDSTIVNSFTAVFTDEGPVLQWVTQCEYNNVFWNIYRSETEDQEESVKVNNAFIPGSGTTAQSTAYAFTDEYEIENGATYYYWVESICFNGASETYGPATLFTPDPNDNQTILYSVVTHAFDNYNVLEWVTLCEYQNSGWNIYRNINDNIYNAVKINQGLIEGAGTCDELTSYSYTDNYAFFYQGITLYYWLESVMYDGTKNLFGPFIAGNP